MNLFRSFFTKIGLISGRTLTTTSTMSIGISEVYPTLIMKEAVEYGFNQNTAVYSIIKEDADMFSSIPRYVYDAALKEQKTLNKNAIALQQLLNRPNKAQGQDAFFALERAFFKVCGESFVWLNRGDLEAYRLADGSFDDATINRLPVLEMYVLPSHLVSVIAAPKDIWGVLGYVLDAGTERLIVRADDVIHWKDTNLNFSADTRVHLRGFSALTAGSVTVAESTALSKSSLRRAQNDGAKGVLFNETMHNMTVEQQTQVKRIVDTKINNSKVADMVATLNGKWGYQSLATDNRASQMAELKTLSWKELCMLLKVPYELFDPGTTYANKKEARVGWVSGPIVQACRKHDDEYNRVLLKAFDLDGKAFIASDYDDMPEVRQSKMEAAKTMQDLWVITPNEIRDFLGYERLADPTFDQIWPVTGRMPANDGPTDQALQLEMDRLNAVE